MAKYVYFFGDGEADGRGDMKNLLGGKGANLAEMTSIGLPVPAGFTVTTEVCTEFYKNNRQYPAGLEVDGSEPRHERPDHTRRHRAEWRCPLRL
jgi:pyruvate,orthophosphate dikinase